MVAERLAAVATFVASKTSGMTPPTEMPDIPFVSRTPNELPQPFSFRDAGIDVLGVVDAHYSMGPYDLGEDEALVLEGTIPPAAFVNNVMLWNKHMQTYEYRLHRQPRSTARSSNSSPTAAIGSWSPTGSGRPQLARHRGPRQRLDLLQLLPRRRAPERHRLLGRAHRRARPSGTHPSPPAVPAARPREAVHALHRR